jgi:hypothetical protein
MSSDSGLALAIGLAIALLIATPFVVVVVLVWRAVRAGRMPPWTLWLSMPLALVTGLWLAFFVVFDDLGDAFLARRAAPTIELALPAGFTGSVYVYFDSALPAPEPVDPQRYRTDVRKSGTSPQYRLTVPASGALLVGAPPGIAEQISYVTFRVTYPDDSNAPQRQPTSSGGAFASVVYARFLVGDERDERLDREERTKSGTLFDEEEVYRSLKAAAAASPRP